MTETWVRFRDTNYMVSNLGNVYRICRKHSKERNLKPNLTKDRYYRVDICINNNAYHFSLHRMVAEMFIPNPNNYPVVNHLDGDKLNNAFWNLEWTTVQGNSAHAVKMGVWVDNSGDKNGRSKFTWQQVGIIREALAAGHRVGDIAKYFKCSSSIISTIRSNKNWVI